MRCFLEKDLSSFDLIDPKGRGEAIPPLPDLLEFAASEWFGQCASSFSQVWREGIFQEQLSQCLPVEHLCGVCLGLSVPEE